MRILWRRGASVHQSSTTTKGGPSVIVRTPNQPWAYGRVIPVTLANGGRRCVVAVSGWVMRGDAAIATSGADISAISDERRLPAVACPTPFSISLVAPIGEEANVIVRSGADGVATDVLIEEITVTDQAVASSLGEPEGPCGRSGWNLALDGRHAESVAERMRAIEIGAANGALEVPWFGGPVSVPTSSQVGRALLTTGTYEPGLLQVLERVIPPGGTIVNAGGHIGILATYLAWLGGPTSTVLAVEPSGRERNCLVRNAAGRRASGLVEVINAALGAEEGTAFINVASDFLSGHNSISRDGDESGEAVALTTIDRIVAGRDGRTTAIVLDVEGMELEVLAGARATIARDRPVVVLEFNPGEFDGEAGGALPAAVAALGYEAVVVETSSGHVTPFPHVPAGSAWAIVARPRTGGGTALLGAARGVVAPATKPFTGANGGTVSAHGSGFIITTPPQAWSYGASAHVAADELGAGNITLVITASAGEGAADLLVADGGMGTILESIRLPCSPRCLRLALPSMWECPAGVNVVIRTAGQDGAATVTLDDMGLERMDDIPVNPALMPTAPEQAAPETMTSGTAAFEDQLAATINTARRAWLASLPLQWQGQHVVDLGCGIGLFAGFFLDRDARYTGVDGRVDNVAAARAAVPGATFLHADARDIDLPQVTGIPDVVLAIGLLYHLDDPLAFLKNIGRSNAGTLILETMVSDFHEPVVLRYPEPLDANQALDGVGCRPSIPWLVQTLRSVGFEAIATTPAPPHHPDFQFRAYGDGSTHRGDNNLRVALVAARAPELVPAGLIPI